MSEFSKYKLTFPKTQIRMTDDDLTFTIGNIKSRQPSVIYFKWYAYDIHGTLISEYTSGKLVVGTEYAMVQENFTPTYLEDNTMEDVDSYSMELYLLNITSENPLWFNKLQLNFGEFKEYHQPNDLILDIQVGFNKNSYINLYDTTDNFLQIIRPNHEDLSTTELTKSKYTILAPHLPNESEFDSVSNIFYEYMYMTEQKIGVEK